MRGRAGQFAEYESEAWTVADDVTRQRAAVVRGAALGLGAYLIWGLGPLLFRALAAVSPGAILAHRIIWSVVFLAGVVSIQRRWGEFRAILRRGRVLAALAVSTSLIGVNWYLFIWSIAHDLLAEASLGYFLMPLASAVLGIVFLRERLRAWQGTALVIAAAGVGWIIWSAGRLPWVALVLMSSFALYGLVRKKTPVGAIVSVLFETTALLPFALAMAAWHLASSDRAPMTGLLWAGLMSTALVTGLPLLMFMSAVRVLRLSTIGFLQFLSPTCQFLVAVLVFGEAVDLHRMLGFCLIWVACGVYLLDSYRAVKAQQTNAEEEEGIPATVVEG